MPFEGIYVSEWFSAQYGEADDTRCPVCLDIARGMDEPSFINIGITPHIFRIVDLPVEGQPDRSAVQYLCDEVSIGFKQYLPSEQLLTALEAIDKGAATQGKANVALDMLNGL